MRFLLLNHIQNAHDSLKNNRMRTGLTIIGVAIGVASIVAVLSLGSGASTMVHDQVEELGGSVAVVRPITPDSTSLERITTQQSHATFAASSLSESDLYKIKALPSVEAAAPLMLITGSIRGDDTTPQNTVAVASTPELFAISQLAVASGQLLDNTTEETTAVIGSQLAVDLYGTTLAVGKTFDLRGERFRVIGVLERQNNPVNYNGVDVDRAAFISVDAGRSINHQQLQIQQINVQASSPDALDDMLASVSGALIENHSGERDFVVLSGSEVAEPSSQLFSAITGVIVAVAAISLLVGGIGIMNIMLVNVAERTREIGIRKSLGAMRSDIIWQFLVESLILSITGGIVGIALGFTAAFILSLFFAFDPAISWHIILVGIAIAAIVGVLFGLYPAARAASKKPIESLRQYS